MFVVVVGELLIIRLKYTSSKKQWHLPMIIIVRTLQNMNLYFQIMKVNSISVGSCIYFEMSNF